MTPQQPQKPSPVHTNLVEDKVRELRAGGQWEWPYTEINESQVAADIAAAGLFDTDDDGATTLSWTVFNDWVHRWSQKREQAG